MDVRYTVDFDLSNATAKAAGIFTRAQLDYSVLPFKVDTFYAAWVDKTTGRLRITDQTFTADLVPSVPLAATTGTLVVEVSGYDPVVVRRRSAPPP